MALKRGEAISVLVEADLSALSEDDRESLLLDWWTIGQDDPDFGMLPEELRLELGRSSEPEHGALSSHYDPLLRIALRRQFVGVRSEYLASRLSALGHTSVDVTGELEVLEQCPCCDFRTLSQRGAYEICGVCFWEDDGSNELDHVSGPNGMTLRQARENFARIGAASPDDAANILPDGQARYERAQKE